MIGAVTPSLLNAILRSGNPRSQASINFRLGDWQEGGLKASFFLEKLSDSRSELQEMVEKLSGVRAAMSEGIAKHVRLPRRSQSTRPRGSGSSGSREKDKGGSGGGVPLGPGTKRKGDRKLKGLISKWKRKEAERRGEDGGAGVDDR